MKKFMILFLTSQGELLHKNSVYFLHKFLLTIFGLLFFISDFHTKFSRIFFIRNSMFYTNVFHFFTENFFVHFFRFFRPTLDRGSNSNTVMRTCNALPGMLFAQIRRPFCQHNPFFW